MDPYGTIRFSNVLRGKERVRWEKWFQTDFFRFKLNPRFKLSSCEISETMYLSN